MAEVIWTDAALADLNDITEYIALENTEAAKRLVQNMFKQVERLEVFPESGRRPPELPHLDYREIVAPPCRIFYKIENDKAMILFVMREERDLRRYLLTL